jgi:uncharacterized protein with HEPN domain
MQPEVVNLLHDVLDAGESIQEFTAGLSFDEFQRSRTIYLAVERQFITVGEALNVALHKDATLRSSIAKARSIVDFRNILVHRYSIIRMDRLWQTIHDDLPLLLAEVRALLPPAP